MSLTDRRGVAVDLGPRKTARPLKPKDVAALAAAYLHAAGVPVAVARTSLHISRATYFRRLDRAADLAARHVEDLA